MKNIVINEALDEVIECIVPGKSCLIFISVKNSKFLEDLVVRLSIKLGKTTPWPIYIVHGSIRGEHNWSFTKLRRGPRLKLLMNGEIVTEVGGLILQQDCPIILLAEEFDMFDQNDQNAYGHLVDESQNSLFLTLYPGSVLIAGLVESNKGRLDPGVANRGIHLNYF